MMKDPLLSLSQLHGEGRVTCRALKAAGFLTLRSVATTSLEDLSERARLSARSARRLQDGAREMIGQGAAADLASAPLRTRARRPPPSPRPRPLPPPLSGPLPCFSQGVTADELRVLRGDAAAPPGSKPAPGA
jgi:hypothetical protein